MAVNNHFWKNKKVVITGHTGFKGSWLSLWLHSLGVNVYGYGLAPATSPALFNILELEKKIYSHIGDIRDFEVLKQYINEIQPEIIIHMAAQPLVRYSYDFPIETYQTNVMGTVNLLESVRQCASVRAVVNVTTDKCYENKEWDWGYRENDRLGGYDPYSNSKACSEFVTSAYRQSYFSNGQNLIGIATARAGNVIGGGDWAQDRLIPDIMTAIINKQTVLIRNPLAIRPWQHVLEPLSGYLTLAEKLWQDPKQYSSSWNFGPNEGDIKPVQEIVKLITRNWPEGSWKIDQAAHPHEAHFLKLDISKAKNHLEWRPRWNLETAVHFSVAWYQAWAMGRGVEEMTLSQIRQYEMESQ